MDYNHDNIDELGRLLVTSHLSPIPKGYDSVKSYNGDHFSFSREQTDLLENNNSISRSNSSISEEGVAMETRKDGEQPQNIVQNHDNIIIHDLEQQRHQLHQHINTSREEERCSQVGGNYENKNVMQSNDFNVKSCTIQTNRYYKTTARDQSCQTMTLSTRIRMESSTNYHFFSPIEDYDMNTIDVQKSFAPALPNLVALVLRFYWLSISIIFTYQDYSIETSQNGHDNVLFFSHLTNITIILTITYQMTSCFLTFVASTHSCTGRKKHHFVLYQPTIHPLSLPTKTIHHDNNNNNSNNNNNTFSSVKSSSISSTSGNTTQYNTSSSNYTYSTRPSILVCFNWLLYTLVLPAESAVAVGYWIFEYDGKGGLEYTNIYKHGIIALLLLIDGNIIGRIPLRIKHIFVPYIYGNLYVIFSIYFAFSDFGSRHNHGVIYRNLNWKNHFWDAAFLSVMLMYVILPSLFMLCYFISLINFQERGRGCRGRKEKYCFVFNCCHCCWYSFCAFTFQGGRRILYHPVGSCEGQPRYITSQPWRRESRRGKRKGAEQYQ